MINSDAHYRFASEMGAEEHFLLISAPSGRDFVAALGEMKERYDQAVCSAGIPRDSLIMSRLFLSDIANQAPVVAESIFFSDLSRGAFSVLEQRPCFGAQALLLAYHVHHPSLLLEKMVSMDSENCRNSVFLRGAHYNLLAQCHCNGTAILSSATQTREALEHLEDGLRRHAMELRENTVRTWIYVRDIDNHYPAMGEERRRFFRQRNLTEETRYIASTGIEAALIRPETLISVDALSFQNLQPAQIVRMEAPTHLCPTAQYGITFERGTKLTFGDRDQLILSGTASIDRNGEIVAPRDIVGQTRRTLENIVALFEPHGADLADLAHAVVYVRNPVEADQVAKVLEREIPGHVPVVMVHAPVCRPGWLVEIEGLAIRPASNSFPPFI